MLAAALLALQGPLAAPPCTLATAVPASVREIARDPNREARFGRCIRLEGLVGFDYFYADVGGVYALYARNRNDRANDGWLGLYFRSGARPRRGMFRGTAWGILDDCRSYNARRDQLPDDQLEASQDLYRPVGACNHFEGLILRSARFRRDAPARLVRLTGEPARRRFGDLRAESPPAQIAALASRFIGALRARDRDALRSLVDLWSESDPRTRGERAALDAYLRGEHGSPLEALITMRTTPDPVFFHELDQLTPHPYPGSWYVCFCRTADCRGRWPIHHFDAGAHSSLPYLCLVAHNERIAAEEPSDLLGLSRRPAPFPEPARAALNRSTR